MIEPENVKTFISDFPHTDRDRSLFTEEVMSALRTLHKEFAEERRRLLDRRLEQQDQFDRGEMPHYIDDHPARSERWLVAAIPEDVNERRVEITGPVNNPKMVINMLNPGPHGIAADMAMLDFEDSMKPSWPNVISGLHNVIGAARGDLTFVQPATEGKPEKVYRLDEKRAHMMIRVRGLHLDEANVMIDGERISAAIFDSALCAFHTAKTLLGQKRTPMYYVPKCEHYLEARWWNRLFGRIEELFSLPHGSLRTTFLIETLPAAFQMEEILYEVRERACGLNGGRWDKIFSDIKVLRNHADCVLADRSYIDMSRPWMDNYAKRLIKICHRHGAFAMGGMSAFTPGQDEETRRAQTGKVIEDKAREAAIGHDGCWVSHPYFIEIARRQFTKKNQLNVLLEGFPDRPDLLPKAEGPKTLEGLRKNIRVGIAYQQGWNNDIGCVAFDNLMEDLATLEISRAQCWQWLHHRVRLDDGTVVDEKLVRELFARELDKIIGETAVAGENLKQSYLQAKKDAEKLFLDPELHPFLTTSSEPFTTNHM